MDQEVKRINNKDQLDQIIEKLFLKLPVQLKQDNGDMPLNITSYTDFIIEVSHDAPPAEMRKLQAVRGENSMVLECRVESRTENSEKLIPLNLHLTRQVRKETRIGIPEKDKRLLWVTNLLTIRNFPDLFAATNDKRDALIKAYKNELSKSFTRVEIFLRLTVRLEYRMRTLINYKKPIYIPNQEHPDKVDPDKFVPYSEYLKLARYEKLPEGIVAEVTEPLLYKKYLLLGYVRVMSENPISLEEYEIVKRVASEMMKNLENYGAFPVNREKSPVVDLNITGVGCMHPHVPSVIKNFMPGENVIFDIHFVDDTIMTYTGAIKNMKSGDRAHRLGIQFDQLSNEQLYPLQEFLAHLAEKNVAN